MPSHAQVAARVRASKEAHPSHYCAHPRCLWRTFDARKGTHEPCPKHESKEIVKIA